MENEESREAVLTMAYGLRLFSFCINSWDPNKFTGLNKFTCRKKANCANKLTGMNKFTGWKTSSCCLFYFYTKVMWFKKPTLLYNTYYGQIIQTNFFAKKIIIFNENTFFICCEADP